MAFCVCLPMYLWHFIHLIYSVPVCGAPPECQALFWVSGIQSLPTRCSENKMRRIGFKPKLQCLLWDHCRVIDIRRVHELSTEALSSTLNVLISFSSEKWDGIITNVDRLIKDAPWIHGVHLRQQHAERILLDSGFSFPPPVWAASFTDLSS